MYRPQSSKVALIIGMDEYDDDVLPRLRSCKKDANDLASILSRELGYSIFDGAISKIIPYN
ncbi:MAG: caspase family protein [Candidatus Nitrosopolaris sp.]|jgi:hypothetical protein